MTRRVLPLLVSLLFAAHTASAQDPHPLDHGSTMLKEGVELERQDKHTEALAKYASVHRSDSLYEKILLQRAFVLIHLERFEEAVAVSEEGIRLDGVLAEDFYDDKAISLNLLKRYDDALAVTDEAIRLYPGNYDPRRLRAEVLTSKNDRAAALAAMEDNVRRFPLCQQAHLVLAAAAQQEDRTAQAALALYAALLVRWNDERSSQVLGYIDQLLDDKLDKDPKGYDLTTGDDFAELDVLLKNKVGMTKGYKCKPDLPYACVRQGHFLLNALTEQQGGTGFWSTFYVPFFRKVVEKDLVEGMLYHCLSNSTDPHIQAIVDKNKKKMDAFRLALGDLFFSTWAVFPDSIGGTFRPVKHQFNDDGDLLAKGDGNIEKTEQTGPWEFYHPNGRLSTTLTYGADHKRSGMVTNYHDNGRIMRQQEWKAGVEDGPFRRWYRNGAMMDSTAVVAGKAQGPYAEFNEAGGLLSRKTFKDGELTGPAVTYLPCGIPEASMDLVRNEVDGPVTWHYPNGAPRFTAVYKDAERNGICETFHVNGAKEKSYIYVNGAMEGPYTEWFANGQVSEEGTFKADKLTGRRRSWYINGVLAVDQTFDDQGRQDGVRRDFDTDGRPETEMEYARGQLIRYRYYDRAGKIIKEDKRSKGRFRFEGYTIDGVKMMQGDYLDEGEKDGKWTWWYPDGTASRDENTVKGKSEGMQREYHTNGKLKVQYDLLPGQGETGPFTGYATDGTVAYKGWLENGKVNGDRLTFFPNGKLREQERYLADERDGWNAKYDADGLITVEVRYVGGEPYESALYDTNGKAYMRYTKSAGPSVQKSIYPDGTPYGSVAYMNTKRHGHAVWNFPDGTKSFEGDYVNGERTGLWRSWHPNGQLATEATYEMDNVVGTSKAWDTDGTLTSEETFDKGFSTSEKFYHDNGQASIERPKRFGQVHGTVKSYSPSGDLQLIRYYRDDRLVGYSYNGTDGSLVDTIPLGQGLVSMRPKYANGKPSREMDLRNGVIDGIYREFNPDGSLLEEQAYTGGERNGEGKEYHGNGKLRSSCNWLNDGRNGEELIRWDNGQPRERCMWVYGQRHGERVMYDRTGKPVITMTYRNGDMETMVR